MTYLTLALLIAILFIVIKRQMVNEKKGAGTERLGTLPIPDIQLVNRPFSFRIVLLRAGRISLLLALITLIISLIYPQTKKGSREDIEKKAPPDIGLGIFLVIDKSGSMAEPAAILRNKMAKIDWAKELAADFIKSRPDDSIGLISFARTSSILSPLTLDKPLLLSRLNEITPVTNDAENGTAIGYALYKTANLIVSTKYFEERDKTKKLPTYTMSQAVIVLITDGLQSPHPDDRTNPYRFIPIEDALAFCRQNNIKVFYIGVDPAINSKEFSQDTARAKNGVEETGGLFFTAGSSSSLKAVDSALNKIEPKKKISTQQQTRENKKSKEQTQSTPGLVPRNSLLLTALIFLAFSILTETLFARRVP